jgi:hypothetical protein
MLDRTRIPPVDIETLPDDLREVLEEQRKLRGAPLYPYLFYARNPAYFRAAHAMWTTVQTLKKDIVEWFRTPICENAAPLPCIRVARACRSDAPPHRHRRELTCRVVPRHFDFLSVDEEFGADCTAQTHLHGRNLRTSQAARDSL